MTDETEVNDEIERLKKEEEWEMIMENLRAVARSCECKWNLNNMHYGATIPLTTIIVTQGNWC
ncbi:MAG: hypothetical protein QXL94_08215 [Candidatus Parvarchaeum sp.]